MPVSELDVHKTLVSVRNRANTDRYLRLIDSIFSLVMYSRLLNRSDEL